MYFYSHSLFLNLLAAVKLNKTSYINLSVVLEGKMTRVSFHRDVSHSRPEVRLNQRLSAFVVSGRGKGESAAATSGHTGTVGDLPHPGSTRERVLSVTATPERVTADKYTSPQRKKGARSIVPLLQTMCFKLSSS